MIPASPGGGVQRRAFVWVTAIAVLVLLRLPSLGQPAGGDQGLYAYSGQRILAGAVMYRDVWDQKPPGIGALYAIALRIWPAESAVPALDMLAAAATAWLLVVLGRRRFTPAVGYAAALLFLVFSDPYLQRLSGIYVRAQTEPFIALAVTAGLALLAAPTATGRHFVGAGIALAAAFWLKYNAAAYLLPLVIAVWAWRASVRRTSELRNALFWIGVAFGAIGLAVIAYFAAHGALLDLRLATIDYNVMYSNETYEGAPSVITYLLTFPIVRARIDAIWFLGGLGALLLLPRLRSTPSNLVIAGWLAAAILSIAINGSRSLPNYFVQADPALALAASAGFASLRSYGPRVRAAVIVVLVAGLWRVGSDAPLFGFRLFSLPGLVENLRYDLRYLRGDISPNDYLSRFKGQKHDALENDALARYIRDTTAVDDPVFVFGFSGGSVGWKSARVSPSRFFWSRPVIVEFASDRPRYGSAGLVEDLRRRPPAVVVLQKEEWRSYDFFMTHAALREWLQASYALDRETPMFSVWRRNR